MEMQIEKSAEKPSADSEENIEGADVDEILSEGWGGDYPLDSLYIRTMYKPVSEIVRRIEEKRFILDPDFQRDLVWTVFKQSKLIESCLMRIPLPVFYVSERSDESVVIVDGLQRLSTFRDYLNNKFSLKFSSSVSKTKKNVLTGKKFKDLPIRLRERIEDTSLTIYVIDKEAPIRAKFDIFDRVNGGVPITRQQMRNALFCGPATEWLKSVVETSLFKSVTGHSLSTRKMRDREAVNRFVSFKLLGWKNYKGDMDEFLADGLENFKEANGLELKKNFEDTLRLCSDVFGIHAFRRSMFEEYREKTVINMSLFDVILVIFSNNIEKLMETERARILYVIRELYDDMLFVESFTRSTNSVKAVKYRYGTIERVIEKLLKEL